MRFFLRLTITAVAAAAFVLVPSAMRAAGTPVTVLCAGAASSAIGRIAHEFERTHGVDVVVKSATVGTIRKELDANAAADVVILSAPAIEALVKRGRLVGGTQVALGRTGIGVGVRAGAPVPDISTPEALKRTLLAARSVASSDPAAGASSGIYFASVLRKMGIAAEVKSKERLVPGGSSCVLVARGEADLCVQNVSEIVPIAGVHFAGPFPPALQNYITYSAAVAARSGATAQVRAFVADASSTRRAALWQRAGFEPPREARMEPSAAR